MKGLTNVNYGRTDTKQGQRAGRRGGESQRAAAVLTCLKKDIAIRGQKVRK